MEIEVTTKQSQMPHIYVHFALSLKQFNVFAGTLSDVHLSLGLNVLAGTPPDVGL